MLSIKIRGLYFPFRSLTGKKKGFQWVKLDLGGKVLQIINTHLVCVYNTNRKNENKSLLSQLEQLINSLINVGPSVVVGDLNFLPYSMFYNKFLEFTGLYDSSKNFGGVTILNNNKEKPTTPRGLRLDYAFLPGSLLRLSKQKIIFNEEINFARKTTYLSDHFGVLTIIDYPYGRDRTKKG